MRTVKDLLLIARQELGNTESPAGSNRTKYGKWMGLDGYAWCMSFVQWCYAQAEVALPVRTGSCGELMRAAQAAGCWVTDGFQPGDVVIYDFSGKKKTTQHCGIVELQLPGYGVQAIEGNTSEAGSQDNGGMVCLKNRPEKYIIGAVRPVFDTEIEQQEDVSKMTIQEFINNLTEEQAYILITKAQAYASKLEEPSWSVKEGHWARALSTGLINGGSPESLIKRDEFVAVMGRAGLID